MATDERKETWKRNAISRRASIVAKGGHTLSVLLEPDATGALNALTGTTAGSSYREVISNLLLKEAKRLKLKLRQAPAGDRSK